MHRRLPVTSFFFVGRSLAATVLLAVFAVCAAPQVRATAVPEERTAGAALAVPLRDYRVQVRALNDTQAHLDFNAVFFGIEAFGTPIKITPDSPLVAKNPKGLLAFIASLIPVFQNFSDPAELEPYLLERSADEYRSLMGDIGAAAGMVRLYRGVQSFELYCGWFVTPQEFLAVLKVVITEEQYLYSPVIFSFVDGEWKLVYGNTMSPLTDILRGATICMALENPRRFQMRYRKALPEEGATMPAANWRSFF